MSSPRTTGHWGMTGFLVQHLSSLVLAAYILCLSGYFIAVPVIDGEALRSFFGHLSMKIFSLVALLSFVAHAWVGLWTVGTDYIRPHYFGQFAALVRFLYHALVVILLAGQSLWWLSLILTL